MVRRAASERSSQQGSSSAGSSKTATTSSARHNDAVVNHKLNGVAGKINKKPKSSIKQVTKKRRKRSHDSDYEDAADAERILAAIKSRQKKKSHSKHRTHANDAIVSEVPYIEPIDSGSFRVRNPTAFERFKTKYEDSHSNKPQKPESGELLETDWLCCLCQRTPHANFLGDLFGPYYLTFAGDIASCVDICPVLKHLRAPQAGSSKSKKASTSSTASTSKKSPQASTSSAPQASSSSAPQAKSRSAGKAMVATEPHEGTAYCDVWFHGDCVCWAPGIFLERFRLVGLEASLPEFWNSKCNSCGKMGASLGCSFKHCQQLYHFPCAQEAGCKFIEETFIIYCPTHSSFFDDGQKESK